MKPTFKHIRHTFWICTLVFVADRVTKILASGLDKPVTLIPGVVGLTYAENTGIAFSLFSGAPLVLGLVSVVILTAGLYTVSKLSLRTGTWVCVMLVLGGALSNALDRIFRGAVPDMVEILAFRWGIFNLADAAVVVGIVLIMIRYLMHPEEWKRSDANSGDSNGPGQSGDSGENG